MTDNVFRAGKKSQDNPFKQVQDMRKAVEKEIPDASERTLPPHLSGMPNPMGTNNPDTPFTMSGQPPKEFLEMMKQRSEATGLNMPMPPQPIAPQPITSMAPPMHSPVLQSNDHMQKSAEFETLLNRLDSIVTWETISLPSKGKFYTNIPGELHVKPMTGYEEQIMTSQRFVKKGEAIDKIFEKCIKEPINPKDLLVADRTYILIFLRGISHTPEYDVEIKCPNCDFKFQEMIHLNALELEICDDSFGPDNLQGILPTSKFSYRYRLPTGTDDLLVNNYREKRLKEFSKEQEDDSWFYRTATLLHNIDGVTNKQELMYLLKKLPVSDVAHLRNEINDPPFGVNTLIPTICNKCNEEFEVELPYDSNFFFPRKKKD